MAYLRVPVIGTGSSVDDAIRPAIDGLVPYSALMPRIRQATCLVFVPDSDVIRLPALFQAIVPDDVARIEVAAAGGTYQPMERIR